jgi:hypothetical protein
LQSTAHTGNNNIQEPYQDVKSRSQCATDNSDSAW